MASESSARDSRRSVRIGNYEVLAHIASGGMGAVYRARHVAQGHEVALKILAPEMAANPATLERFRREARHAAKLRHENVVAIHEFGESRGTWFLAMEFVDGIDLHEYISRKGRLDPAEARQITIQAARALDHAAGQGIVHRDIKPSNFLLTRKDGRLLVKLTDLGLARETRAEEFRVTREGSTVGTVDYIAPEQARDSGRADVRSDIYSLGCTLYHMLAGAPPFPEGSLTERLLRHIEVDPPDVRSLNPRVPEALQQVLQRMLAKKPKHRYQTAAELLEALEQAGDPARPAPAPPDILAGLGQAEVETPRSRTRKSADTKTMPRPSSSAHRKPRRRARPRTDPALQRRTRLWLLAGGLLLAAVVVWLVLGRLTDHRRASAGPAAAGTAEVSEAKDPERQLLAAVQGAPGVLWSAVARHRFGCFHSE
jgi:eukaryotic-like serine/threonine-protein kinase